MLQNTETEKHILQDFSFFVTEIQPLIVNQLTVIKRLPGTLEMHPNSSLSHTN